MDPGDMNIPSGKTFNRGPGDRNTSSWKILTEGKGDRIIVIKNLAKGRGDRTGG